LFRKTLRIVSVALTAWASTARRREHPDVNRIYLERIIAVIDDALPGYHAA